jgi:hypothetical protein
MNTAGMPALFEAALRALIAAIVVWSALRLLRVRNVRTQKTAWTLVLIGALAMPLLMRWQWLPAGDEISLPSLSRELAPALSSLRALSLPAAPALPWDAAGAHDAMPVPPPFAWTDNSIEDNRGAVNNAETDGDTEWAWGNSLAAQSSPTASAPLARDVAARQLPATAPSPTHAVRMTDLAWLIYLTVAGALLFRLLVGVFSAIRLWTTAHPVLSPVPGDLALSGSVRWSPRVNSPANLGSGVVLPADYGEWSAEKLRVVLAHETAHVRQGDFYLQLLAGLYAALMWFSPLGWWLKRKLTELGEAMGDRAGLEEAVSPSSYARMLLEFAALPRPTRTGVAMARTRHLTSRIERLLNDSTFRQAFSGSSRRTVLALAVTPLALLASAELVRVQAAGQTTAPAQQAGRAQTLQASQPSGVSNPPAQTITDQDQQPAPAQAPAPPNPAAAPQTEPQPAAEAPAPAPESAPIPDAMPGPPALPEPGQDVVPPVPPDQVKVPPMPPVVVLPPMPPMPDVDAEVNKAMMQLDALGKNVYMFRDSPFFAFDGGDPWALVPAQGEPATNMPYFGPFRGNDRAEIDEARKSAHAPFFWFSHEGKSYVVEDPSVVAQVEALEKPLEDLRSQMRAIGKQQRDLGQQLRQQMREQRQTSIPKPDLSKQMADLNAAVNSLESSQGDTVTRDQLMNMQRQIAALQARLYASESGMYKQNGEWGAAMGAFGKQMGKLGAEQGRLGGEMGRLSVSNRDKIDAIIDQSLKDGKARPVK